MIYTGKLLKSIVGRSKLPVADQIAPHLTTYLPAYGVGTLYRAAHFLAQAAHESDGFRTLYEYWGPTEAQKKYEGAKRLGNTQAGDGYRFRGRGIFQLTGRANYTDMSKIVGVDLVKDPEAAADPELSVRIACIYWERRGLNALADADDVEAITKKINGGYNGLEDRKRYLKRAKEALENAG